MTALTGKEKSERLRRRREKEGLKEVRSIWAPPAKHTAIKAEAKRMLKK